MAKTAAAAVRVEANTSESASAAEGREPPMIAPSSVFLNEAGQMWRSVLVRCPKEMVADDLRTSSIWKRVQCVQQSALLKLDQLLCIAHDESWICEARVTHASNIEAKLLIQRVSTFAPVASRFYSDGTLEIVWSGAGFDVIRMSDKVPISAGHSSEGLAIDALRAYYPKTVR